ncbi:MAG: hypothetical protein Q7S66_05010 [bacterium]|nr:hypothetical protein [bacterium]
MTKKTLFLLALAIPLITMGAGCAKKGLAALSIELSENSSNKSEYDTATFVFPSDWKSSITGGVTPASGQSFKLTSPDGAVTLEYPSKFEGDLPPGGVEKPLIIMGKEHTRYIVASDAKNGLTTEMIRGPVIDSIGTRPVYMYPNGSYAGDIMANIFASMKLETKKQKPTAEELAETRDGPTDNPVSNSKPQIATFTIKEFGITFQIPAIYKDDIAYKINDLNYEKKDARPLGATAYLYSKSVLAKDSNCGAGSIGAISLGTKLYNQEGDERSANKNVDVKIGNDYVSIEGPQDLCTGSKDLQKEIMDRVTALHSALLTVEGTEK